MSIPPPNQQAENDLGGVVPLVELVAGLTDFVATENECAAQDGFKDFSIDNRYAVRINLHDSDDTQLGGEV